MKKTTLILSLLIAGGIVALLTWNYYSNKQSQKLNCPQVPNTDLQILNDTYLSRIHLFKNSDILKKFSKHYGKDHPLSVGTFPIDSFIALIDKEPTANGLKIYFGALNQEGTTTDNAYSKDFDHLVVPIFVFTHQHDTVMHRDFGAYYIFNPHSNSLVTIDIKSAQAWIKHFRKDLEIDRLEVLKLWYDLSRLKGWEADIACQRSVAGNNIDSISLDWGIYDSNIKDPSDGKTLITTINRFTMLFNVPNARPAAYKLTGDYDTAVPCPPGQNCDGDNLNYP